MKRISAVLMAVLLLLSLFSCVSIEDIAMRSAANMLSSDSGGANIFTMDDDPELIADALPLAMKLYEMVLASNPEHAAMQYATGKNFIMYANAFIQTPAGMLPDDEYLKQEVMLARAKRMYLRGRDYVIDGIELNHPGFITAVDDNRLDDAVSMLKEPEDAAMLYWAASAWIGAYSCDPFDFELASSLYVPSAMLLRALELDGGFSNGAIHDVFIQIYSSLPYSHILKAAESAPETTAKFNNEYYGSLGIADSLEKKTMHHFNTSLELSGGTNPGTYCSYASSVSVKKQNYKEYKSLLEKALEINPADYPENELVISIYQEKAAWMLEHAEDFFITLEE
ncbi:MAG: TRAP transporter TatT component family protein [Spirochaetales bacterium]|uniref:TRAP transporter TatT component family protein n=1 Tax=Candidatus Thalassospirochaeta sargassi TaxID=3119039 RepID=A0AAJ1MPT8_9SPIO|nr:TRAP transporter TatT component family protein [Spirochaetales bacterium]